MRRDDHFARPAGFGRHPGHAGGVAPNGLQGRGGRQHGAHHGSERPSASPKLGFVHGQRGHGHAPAHRRLGVDGRKRQAARRAAHARAAHRRSGGRLAPAGLPDRLHRPRRLSAAAPARPQRLATGPAHPGARRRLEPVLDGVAVGTAFGGAAPRFLGQPQCCGQRLWPRHRHRGGGRAHFQALHRHHPEPVAALWRDGAARGLAALHHSWRQPLHLAGQLASRSRCLVGQLFHRLGCHRLR